MTSFTVKNIPPKIYEKIRKNALIHHRSINSEIIVSLEKALGSRSFDPDEFLARVEALHKDIKIPPLTDELLRQAKEEGRS